MNEIYLQRATFYIFQYSFTSNCTSVRPLDTRLSILIILWNLSTFSAILLHLDRWKSCQIGQSIMNFAAIMLK